MGPWLLPLMWDLGHRLGYGTVVVFGTWELDCLCYVSGRFRYEGFWSPSLCGTLIASAKCDLIAFDMRDLVVGLVASATWNPDRLRNVGPSSPSLHETLIAAAHRRSGLFSLREIYSLCNVASATFISSKQV